MNPEFAKDISECFPQLLLVLLTMSINKEKKESTSDTVNADLVHRVNCVVIGKLILIHPDVLG